MDEKKPIRRWAKRVSACLGKSLGVAWPRLVAGGRLQMFENRHLLIVQDITHGLMMFLAQGLEGIALGVSAIEGLVSQRLGLAHELLAGVVQFGALFVVQAPARI